MFTLKIETGARQWIRRQGNRNAGLYLRIDWNTGAMDVHARHSSWGFPMSLHNGMGSMYRLDERITNKRIREIVTELRPEISAAVSGWSVWDGPCGRKGRFTDDGYDAKRAIESRLEVESMRAAGY